MDYFPVFLFTDGLSIGICLGAYPLMLDFYRCALGALASDVGLLSGLAWGASL